MLHCHQQQTRVPAAPPAGSVFFWILAALTCVWASQVGLVVKNPPANAEDIRDAGRSPGEGHGNPLQYSCLESCHGQRSLEGYSPWGLQRVGHDWTHTHLCRVPSSCFTFVSLMTNDIEHFSHSICHLCIFDSWVWVSHRCYYTIKCSLIVEIF